MLTSMCTSCAPSTLMAFADFMADIEEISRLFYMGELADDLDNDREEYVTSHEELLQTLNPGIVGLTYRKSGNQEFSVLRFRSHVIPVNITRLSDEEVTNTLMDYAWNCVREG